MKMVCNSDCNGCVYKGIVQGHVPCCNYIFMEDKRRPCPPGTAPRNAPRRHIRRRCGRMSKSGGKYKQGNIGKGGW